MGHGKRERLSTFLKRLKELPAAQDHDEALEQVRATLNAVEDEMTSIPCDPGLHRTDGRMYPPQDDSARTSGEPEGVVRYRSARHNTRIDSEGAIRIDEVGGACLLNKAGKTGKTIELP